jgi:hypothetical protein
MAILRQQPSFNNVFSNTHQFDAGNQLISQQNAGTARANTTAPAQHPVVLQGMPQGITDPRQCRQQQVQYGPPELPLGQHLQGNNMMGPGNIMGQPSPHLHGPNGGLYNLGASQQQLQQGAWNHGMQPNVAQSQAEISNGHWTGAIPGQNHADFNRDQGVPAPAFAPAAYQGPYPMGPMPPMPTPDFAPAGVHGGFHPPPMPIPGFVPTNPALPRSPPTVAHGLALKINVESTRSAASANKSKIGKATPGHRKQISELDLTPVAAHLNKVIEEHEKQKTPTRKPHANKNPDLGYASDGPAANKGLSLYTSPNGSTVSPINNTPTKVHGRGTEPRNFAPRLSATALPPPKFDLGIVRYEPPAPAVPTAVQDPFANLQVGFPVAHGADKSQAVPLEIRAQRSEMLNRLTSGPIGRPTYEIAMDIANFPFVEMAKLSVPATYGVVKLKNVSAH